MALQRRGQLAQTWRSYTDSVDWKKTAQVFGSQRAFLAPLSRACTNTGKRVTYSCSNSFFRVHR